MQKYNSPNHFWKTLDLRDAYHSISLFPVMASLPCMSDDSSSEDEPMPQALRVTEEERRGTVPGSAEATAMAMGMRAAQPNPLVRRQQQDANDAKRLKRKEKKERKERHRQKREEEKAKYVNTDYKAIDPQKPKKQ